MGAIETLQGLPCVNMIKITPAESAKKSSDETLKYKTCDA
jgi:hypothetical protein